MKSLSFSILIIPLLAISIGILLYVVLLQKTKTKKIFKHYVLMVMLIAFTLNAIWEVLQISLYQGGT